MKPWSFEEDYILCKICDENKYVFIEAELLDTIIRKLETAGFEDRSRSAVRKRAFDCISLLCGQDARYVSDIQKDRCEWFSRRKQAQHNSEEIQSYVDKNYACNDAADLEAIATAAPNIMELLPIDSPTPTFVELLRTYINRSNMTEPQVYKRAQIGRDTFSKIYSGKKGASKDTVMQLCFGLKLTYNESVQFMTTANHGFNSSNIRDLVIMYFLKNQVYDTYEVNAELFERKERLLFDGRYAYCK